MKKKRLRIYNQMNEQAILAIEPVGEEYAISAGGKLTLIGNFDLEKDLDLLEFTLHKQSDGYSISVWAPETTVVMQNGEELKSLNSDKNKSS